MQNQFQTEPKTETKHITAGEQKLDTLLQVNRN